MSPETIVVADDHPLFQQALQGLLQRQFPQATIYTVSSAQQLQQLLTQPATIDLVLLDLSLSDSQGFATLTMLRRQYPTVGVIVISGQEQADTITQAQQLGANGFVPKSQPVEAIVDAINAVMMAETWFPDSLNLAPDPQQQQLIERINSLSPRQYNILSLFAQGLMNKQIAQQLEVSEATVKAHASTIFLKLGVQTRTQAVIVFNQLQNYSTTEA